MPRVVRHLSIALAIAVAGQLAISSAYAMVIIVDRLHVDTTSEMLEQLFEEYGEVEASKVIMDRETGKSSGFGFVEMPAEEEAYDAIDELNNIIVDGSKIEVRKATQDEERLFRAAQRHDGGR